MATAGRRLTGWAGRECRPRRRLPRCRTSHRCMARRSGTCGNRTRVAGSALSGKNGGSYCRYVSPCGVARSVARCALPPAYNRGPQPWRPSTYPTPPPPGGLSPLGTRRRHSSSPLSHISFSLATPSLIPPDPSLPPPLPLQPGGSCIYFKNMADSTAGPGAEKTVLSLQGYTAMAATDTGKPFGFRLVCPGQRTYTLAPEAETEECRTKWCVACGLDFVRLSGSLVVARSSSSHARCVPVGSSSSPA